MLAGSVRTELATLAGVQDDSGAIEVRELDLDTSLEMVVDGRRSLFCDGQSCSL